MSWPVVWVSRSARCQTDPVTSRLLRVDLIGTAMFVAALGIAVPLRDHRGAQVLIAVVSIALFAAGVVATLWAYATALERSRVDEIGVANLYFVTGTTAPPAIKRRLLAALVVQVVASVTAATIGVVGLQDSQLNALAFAVLVPMFGIGMNGAWTARYGSFGPRIDPATKPTNRKIG